jgi:hypothetical protein
MSVYVQCSIGELWDKCSILLIKRDKITDGSKLKNVQNELVSLGEKMNPEYYNHPLFLQLKTVNEQLWEIEDQIRIKEKNKEFDAFFIELARGVYVKNDKRAEIKKEINVSFHSTLQEEKQYVMY